MPFAGEWCRIWIYFGFVFAWAKSARPRFDTSTDMGLVLIPSDAEVDSVIFRLRATDQDADFPLVFEITATITPVVRIDNLPCTLYNKVCQANVILTKRLVPGRLHDFAVRVRDTKGDSNSMQATISVTNATTPRDKIFPHIPSLIMVPEDTKPGKELDYLLVRANPWSGKPVYIELWQPKELFTIRQRQTPTQTRGVITLIGELDFETQSMYTLTMYATDPYTEPGKDTRNIAGLSVVVVVQDVQDVPPIFTLAPPLTRINNSVQPGDIILRVHAEDGDKGVPREIVYGLVSESNPFTPFFNISETSGEISLARPLEELTQITHVGAPVVLTVVAEEIRRSREEPPAQATVVDVGFLLGEPGNSPPYFESDNYIATINENLEPGTVINFGEQYSTRVKDEDIGKAGVFALKLENNNSTFEIIPTVAERSADFLITVRDNTLIDYELYKVLSFKIVAQEVGPATNLSTSVPVTIFLRDINDNPPIFEEQSYEVTLSENVTAGSRVIQVHATDKDTGVFGSIRYTSIKGEGSEAFTMDPNTGLITVAMGSSLDREIAPRLVLSVEARDENGNGNRGTVPLIINLLDVNDNAPTFENDIYQFMLNSDLTNFTSPAFIKAIDADAEPPNNVVRYELVHGNYENKFYLNETSGELILRSPITKIRRKKQSAQEKLSKKIGKEFVKSEEKIQEDKVEASIRVNNNESLMNTGNKSNSNLTNSVIMKIIKERRRRAVEDALYSLTARAYDLGVPHLSSVTQIRILSGIAMEARIMMFVVPGERPDSMKTAETLAAITGGRVTVLETRPYIQQNHTGSSNTLPGGGKKSIVIARVEQTEPGTPLVDVEKIRETLAANGVGIINGTDTLTSTTMIISNMKPPVDGTARNDNNNMQTSIINNTITSIQSEEVTVYKAENKLLLWLLIILGLLMLLAIAILIICCIHPGCPFYMAPRKRRVHSSETLVVRADGRPKRHLHRQPAVAAEVSWNGRKQAWSADPTRRNWQFNKRNVKNCSLPGDVAYVSRQPNDVQMNVEAHRLTEDPPYDHSRRSRMDEQERLYMEDIDGQKGRAYDAVEMDSLQRHEMDRGSDVQRHAYRQSGKIGESRRVASVTHNGKEVRHLRILLEHLVTLKQYMEPSMNEETSVREQHFYREGNAEVLRLVTRGQVEDTSSHLHHPHHHRSTTLIVDGKDIILQRFIEDQKSRHELSVQDIEAARSMESHQRSKEMFQQQAPEIILIPDKLDLGHRQHVEEIGPNVQRLVIDHGDYEKESQIRDAIKQERQGTDATVAPMAERPPIIDKDTQAKSQYPFHDLELARQNALLTRLLLERENKRPGGGGVDSTSYLETQSLPGQVAIATQTDRTAATQTERQVRSRSDNDESDEESRHRKKMKSRKKYGEGEWRRSRTLWMKSPIEEEGSPCFDKRLSILRKKVKEVKEGKKISLEPEVLREISDSLDGNGSSCKAEEDESTKTYRKSTEQTSISYKILNEKKDDSQSSEEARKREKSCEDVTDDQKMNITESTSSPEIKIQRERTEDKSPRKEGKSKSQKKADSMIKPSFRILEKEFTMLTKKLSKLGDKRLQGSTSDSTSQEKLEPCSKKEPDHKSLRKTDNSQKQTIETGPSVSRTEQKAKQKKDAAIAKTKQKLKYQQTHVMSTGSSEYDDALDKSKRVSGTCQETKQKHPIHGKLKRQPAIDRRETKKQTEQETGKRKHSPPRGTPKIERKAEKRLTRAPKLSVVSHKGHVSEGTSTSTEDKKDAFNFSDFKKKSSSLSSDKDYRRVVKDDERKGGKKAVQRFSDDFVEESEAATKQDAKSVKIETIPSKEESSVDKMKQLIKSGLGYGELLVEKLKKSEQPPSTEEMNKTPVDDKQQSIKDHVIDDSIQMKKEEIIEIKDTAAGEQPEDHPTSQIESTIKESERQIVDVKDDTKPSEKDDSFEGEMKTVKEEHEDKIIEDSSKDTIKEELEKFKKNEGEHKSDSVKDTAEVEDKVEKCKEEYKLLDDTKKHTDKIEDVQAEKDEGTKKLDAAHEHLKERVERLFEDHEKEIGDLDAEHKIKEIFVKPSEMSSSLDDTHKDVESKQHIEEKINVKEKEKDVEIQGNSKADLIQKPEEVIEYYIVESPKSEIYSMEKELSDKSEKYEKEEKLCETDKQKEEHVEYADMDEKPVITEEEEEVIKIISTGDGKEEICLDTFKDEEISDSIKTDDQQSEKSDFLDKEKIEEIKKESDVFIEDLSSVEDKSTDKEREEDTVKSKSMDHTILEQETTYPDKDEISDEGQKVSTEVAIDLINKEDVSSLKKEETFDREPETVTKTEMGDHQIKDKENAFQIVEEKTIDSTYFDKETASDEKEAFTGIDKTADQEISETDSIFFDEEKGKHPEETKEGITKDIIQDNQITEENEIKDKYHDQQEEITSRKDTIKDDQITEKDLSIPVDEIKEKYHDEQKEVIIETKTIDDSQISKEELEIPKSMKIEELDSKVEEKAVLSEVKYDKLNIDENINDQETNGDSKTPIVEELNLHETVPSNLPVSIIQDVKKETIAEVSLEDVQTTEEKSAFPEMFKGVHSLVDTLATKGELIPTETESEIKEVASHQDDAETSKSEASLSKLDGESFKHTEENRRNIEETREEMMKRKLMMPAEDKTESTSEDTIKEDLTVDVIKKSKAEGLSDSKQIVELSADEAAILKKLNENKEPVESLDDKLSSPIKMEKMMDQPDVAEESLQSTESEIVPKSGTVDDKVEENTKKEEELHELPLSFQETSSPGSKEASKEKFLLDPIASEILTDSKKIVEPEEQLKLVSEQVEPREDSQQSVGKQISSANEDETQPLPEEQPRITMISQDEESKQDAEGTLLSKESMMVGRELKDEAVGERYADVSLPLFTSIIDTMDDSDDSDSSSDISRKTTLTTRPYQTPRHRARQSPEKESARTEVHDIEDEEKVLIVELEDEDTGVSKEITMFEKSEEQSKDEATVLNEENRTTVKVETASGYTKIASNVEEENVQKKKQSESKSISTFEEFTSKHTKETKSKSHETSSIRKHLKIELTKSDDKRMKDTERKKAPFRGKKKSSSEESSEEKAFYFQDATKFRKKPPDKQSVKKESPRVRSRKMDEDQRRKQYALRLRGEKEKKSAGGEKHSTPPKTGEIDTSKAQPKYMAWYKKNREEMEKKRAELIATDEEDQLPRWLRRSMKNQKSDKDNKRTSTHKVADATPRTKQKVKPLVNVESEQLKAIVRQGRKLRRAEGGKNEDPPVQIFATTPPAAPQGGKHHLVQHSEYKYEKVPPPFYLHPPPVPHPSPQLSPQHFEIPPTMEPSQTEADFDSGIAISLQGGNRLRHQQLLEKKSVFDIAYSEAAPSQLRSDSTTPPS
ncbi:uncharacterized protein LOC143305366 [Osmia lignaria lignaria]|uniref:uncharacterized protein LOC143305366 n=1 Tax=Osmia lignaria lignaria TaxID=1437193 RepID=UPI00402BB15F